MAHSFSTYTKFSEKLIFITHWYAYLRTWQTVPSKQKYAQSEIINIYQPTLAQYSISIRPEKVRRVYRNRKLAWNGLNHIIYPNSKLMATQKHYSLYHCTLLILNKFNINFNSLNAKVAIIQKPVNWFTLQINWLVSIWWQLFGF